MLLLALLVAGVVTVPLGGGRLTALGEVRFRGLGALCAALATQILIISVFPHAPGALLAAGHISSYCWAAYFLFVNRRIPGLWLLGLGAGMNFAAILLNGGVMPAAHSALVAARLLDVPGQFENSRALADPHLAFLGDVFALPYPLPFHNVFSPGDVCIALGAIICLHRLCGSRFLPSGNGEFTSLFRERNFLPLWVAQGISNMGDWMYSFAIAASLAQRTGSAHVLAALLIAQVAPAVLASLLAGPLIDRLRRKRLMIFADLVRGAAVASLLLGHPPRLAHLYGVAMVIGIFESLFQASFQAALPNLLPKDRIVGANSLINATYNLSIMVGPAVGGLLIARFSLGPVLAIDAATFLASALLLARIHFKWKTHAPVSASTPWQDLKEGIRYTASTPIVRGLLVVIGLVLLGSAVRRPVEPLFVFTSLGQDAQAFGIMGGIWGVGMVLGSAATPSVTRQWGSERVLTAGVLLVGACVLLASRQYGYATVLLLWLLSGFGNAIGATSYETILMKRTADHVRGRVMAASQTMLNAAFLIGLLVASPLRELIGIRGVFASSGALLVGTSVLSLFMIPRPRTSPSRPVPAEDALEHVAEHVSSVR